MKVVLISDIHGNLPALQAVLKHVEQHHPDYDKLVCLGDISTIGPFPKECLQLVRERCDLVLQGNHELYALGKALPDDWETCPSFTPTHWTRNALNEDDFRYLEQLPLHHHLEIPGCRPLLLTHASPTSQFVGFMPADSADKYNERLGGVKEGDVACGHVHVQLLLNHNGVRIMNPGSVGMPLDDDPMAKYAVLTVDPAESEDAPIAHWSPLFYQVPYDVEETMKAFDETGLQEYGHVVTAVFRYQMLTGIHVAGPYLRALRKEAEKQDCRVADIYPTFDVPECARQWIPQNCSSA